MLKRNVQRNPQQGTRERALRALAGKKEGFLDPGSAHPIAPHFTDHMCGVAADEHVHQLETELAFIDGGGCLHTQTEKDCGIPVRPWDGS